MVNTEGAGDGGMPHFLPDVSDMDGSSRAVPSMEMNGSNYTRRDGKEGKCLSAGRSVDDRRIWIH